MLAKRTAITTAVLVLTGCIPAYVPPTREDAATLSLVRKGEARVNVHGFGNGKECRDRVNLVPEGLVDEAKVRIPPDEEFTVLALLFLGNRSCDVAATFQPKAGESYAAVIGGTQLQCGMTILRRDGATWVPEKTTRKRSWHVPLISQSEAQCD